jgi:hypothetical protein
LNGKGLKSESLLIISKTGYIFVNTKVRVDMLFLYSYIVFKKIFHLYLMYEGIELGMKCVEKFLPYVQSALGKTGSYGNSDRREA